MSAPLTEHDLFTALRGYASTLEVQYMIEEEVKKFQEKVLPRLFTEALAANAPTPSPTTTIGGGERGGAVDMSDAPTSEQTAATAATSSLLRASTSSSPSPAAGAGVAAPHMPDAEWVQTFLRAHAEDAMSRCLPTMIAAEVARQLLSFGEAAPPPSSPRSTGLGDAAAVVAAARSRAGLPPLPPSPPRLPLASSLDIAPTSTPAADGVFDRSVADAHHRDAHATATHDEGRQQREQILSAIADIEHQVNGIQRELNAVLQQQQRARLRVESLCDALEPPTPAPQDLAADAVETGPESLCTALERALDEREVSVVRTRLATVLAGLLPRLPTSPPPPSARQTLSASESAADAATAMDGSERWLSVSRGSVVSLLPHTTSTGSQAPDGPPRLSMRPPGRIHRDPSATSPPTGPLAPAPAFLTSVAPRVTSPPRSPSTRSQSPPTVPSLNAAPSTSVTARTLDFARTEAAATTAATVLPARPVRAITTRGTAQSANGSAAKVAAPSTVAAPLSQIGVTSPAPPPSLRQPSRHLSSEASVTAAAAAARPAPTPREGACSVTRGRATTTPAAASGPAAAAAATATTSTAAPPRRTSPSSFPPPLAVMRGSPTKRSGSPLSSPLRPRHGEMVVLGVDAVNIPAGMLPGALGRQGAVRVQSVAAHQLAERAGIYRGDVLLSVDRRAVRSCEELCDVLAAVRPSQSAVAVELYRHTAHQIITVTLRL